MFQNQKEEKGTIQNLSQDKDLKIEDIPIHTMAKDLKEIEHPSKPAVQKESSEPVNPVKLTEKQKTSPFLNPNPEPKPAEAVAKISIETLKTPSKPEAQPQKPKIETQPQIQAQPQPAQPQFKPQPIQQMPSKPAPQAKPAQPETPKKNLDEKQKKNMALKIVSAAVLILLVAIVGTGIYYYVSTRPTKTAGNEPSPAPKPSENGNSTNPNPSPEPAQPEFSATNPNYLPIDMTAATSDSIKQTLSDYANKVKFSNITTPVEFVVTDETNAPIDFDKFATLAGLTLPDGLLGTLDKSFSLFFFNDDSNMKIGLAINTLNQAKSKTAMLAEEPNLAKALTPLLLASNYTLNNTPFGEATYKTSAVRYQNIISAKELSIDYTFYNGQLMIGTTQKTLEAMIDKQAAQTAATDTQNTAATAQTIPAGSENTEATPAQ